MSAQAEVTVVIPCFNHGRFLADCIGSLERQTHRAWRAIVLDDASTDGETPALCDALASERVSVVHVPENLGRAGVRNVGIEMAKTEAILNLDADDMLAPEYLARTVPRLFESPRCGIVYTDYQRFGGRSEILRARPFDPVAIYTTQYIFGCNLFRKSAFQKTPGYRREFNIGNEDWDIWLSIVEAGYTGAHVPEPLYLYRHHEGAWSSQSVLARAAAIRASRELLRERHRAGYERTGQLGKFDRDTELEDGRMLLSAGEIGPARQSLVRALRRMPLTIEPWGLLLRSLFARPARTGRDSR